MMSTLRCLALCEHLLSSDCNFLSSSNNNHVHNKDGHILLSLITNVSVSGDMTMGVILDV